MRVSSTHGTTVIDNPDRELLRLIGLKHRIRLEAKGLKFKGRSARSMAKELLGYSPRGRIPDHRLIGEIQERITKREAELGIKTVVRE